MLASVQEPLPAGPSSWSFARFASASASIVNVYTYIIILNITYMNACLYTYIDTCTQYVVLYHIM